MPGSQPKEEKKDTSIETSIALLKQRQNKVDDVVMNMEQSYHDLKRSSELNNQLLKQSTAHIAEKVDTVADNQQRMFEGINQLLNDTVDKVKSLDSSTQLKYQGLENIIGDVGRDADGVRKAHGKELSRVTETIVSLETRVSSIERLKTVIIGISLIVGFIGTCTAIAVGIKTLFK